MVLEDSGEGGTLFVLLAIELLQRLQFVDQRFVLLLQNGHPVLKALNILLLLSSALLRRFPVRRERERSQEVRSEIIMIINNY